MYYGYGIGDFVASFKGESEGHPFRGNQYGSSGASAGGNSDIVTNTDNWRKGTFKPSAWSEVEANKGDKFMLMGRGDEPLMEMQITKADPFRRFPIARITKVVNSNPKDREIAEHFLP